MARRQVTRTGKDQQGDITRLCGDGFSVPKTEAISQIETGVHSYYVQLTSLGAADVRVVNGPRGKYLRTDPDKTTKNNLDDLPNC